MKSTIERCAIAVWDRAACTRSRPLSAGGARWGLQDCRQLTGAGPLAFGRLVAGSGMMRRRSPTGAAVRPMSDLSAGSSFADDDQVFWRGVDGMHGRIESGHACRHAHVVASWSRGEKCARALMCRRTCRVRARVRACVRACVLHNGAEEAHGIGEVALGGAGALHAIGHV